MKHNSYAFFKKKSLFKRIFIPMCLLVALIACFIIGIGSYYDIIGELDDNSRQLFDKQVSDRTHDLQTKMLSKWSNLEAETDRIQKITKDLVESGDISLNNLSVSSNDSQVLLENVSDEVITMLRNHGTTGAYLFLSDGKFEGEETQFYPGLYVSDTDPDSAYKSQNTDLLLSRSPVELIHKLNISTNSNWQPSFEFHKEDLELYKKVFNNFKLVLDNPDFSFKDVGYWTQPYQLYGSDTYCISYLLPLIYNQEIYGAIGVDISFPYLQKILAYDELTKTGNSGYMLALQTGDQTYQSMFLNGPYYSRTFDQFMTFDMTGTKEHSIQDKIYCFPHTIELYNTNTPYANKKWVLIGLVDKSELYGFSEHLMNVLCFAVVFIILIGALLSFVLTRYITKPIIQLANRISKTSNAVSRVNIEKTNITEIDQLTQAIEKMSNDVLDSATRFTNIIRLANTNLAGFEIDSLKDELFITDGFFDIFMLHDINTKELTVAQFNTFLKTFDSCAMPTQNTNEYIYHIEANGEQIYLRLRYHLEENKCFGLIEEISDMIKERKLIEHERDHDILTGLVNRRAFQRQMKKLFTVHTDQLKIAALVMIDLDNLKTINDKYGHDCGDAYIKAAAKIFKKFSPQNTIISRTSGDEFYLFYYGYESREGIDEQLNSLKEGLHQTKVILPNHEEIKVHVSGGVAWYPDDSTNFDELQRYSDYAMYSIKHSVKGEIGTFNISDYQNNAFVLKKRLDYHQFIDGRMATYSFQPIIDIHTGDVFGYEALMRSLHPTLKDPKEIISLAKLEGQLNKIELITWQEALRAFEDCFHQGLITKKQKLFINSISSQMISTIEIERLEQNYGNLLDCVVLEIAEDEENNQSCFHAKKEILNRWHAQVALDDYGSGYNSERNLLLIDPTYVKIDMDLIRDIDKDIDKQKIVENVVSYCHERNKKVIAEGVETIPELNIVMYLEIDYVQGFLFARPESVPPMIDQDSITVLKELNEKMR